MKTVLATQATGTLNGLTMQPTQQSMLYFFYNDFPWSQPQCWGEGCYYQTVLPVTSTQQTTLPVSVVFEDHMTTSALLWRNFKSERPLTAFLLQHFCSRWVTQSEAKHSNCRVPNFNCDNYYYDIKLT